MPPRTNLANSRPDLLPPVPDAAEVAINFAAAALAVAIAAGGVIVMLWNNNTAAPDVLWRHHVYVLPANVARLLIDAGDARIATPADIEIAGHQLRDLTDPAA